MQRYIEMKQRGSVTAETMIILPVLLLLFVGIGEVGRALMHYNTLAKGVRDGARYLATNALDDFTNVIDVTTTMEDEAKNLARYGNIAGNGATLLPNYTAGQLSLDVPDAQHVTLIADYQYVPAVFTTLPTFGFGSDISMAFTMQASVTMRAL